MKKLTLLIAAVLFGGIVTAMAAQPILNGPPGAPTVGTHQDDAAVKNGRLHLPVIANADAPQVDGVIPSSQMKTLVPSNVLKTLSAPKVAVGEMKKTPQLAPGMLFPQALTTGIKAVTAALMLPSHVPRRGSCSPSCSSPPNLNADLTV